MSPLFRLAYVIAAFVPGLAFAQNLPVCPPSETHRFDFMIGDWRGREYVVKDADSTLDDAVVAHNRKLPYGCAYEERWEFTPHKGSIVRATVLRGYDLSTKSWQYTLVSNYVELATFESAQTDSGWVFTHDIAGAVPAQRLRIHWVPTPSGYTESVQVSPDSGRTWRITRHMNYVRSRREGGQ